MSAEKLVTERAAVLRERKAYAQRARDDYNDTGWVHNEERVHAKAAARYPLPTRPRVVRDPQRTNYGPASGHCGPLYWAVRDGRIIPVTATGEYVREWEDDQRRDSYPTTDRVAMWADLLANPTEEVDE